MRDITLGQYYPSNSFVHQMDPRFKICAMFACMISLFITNRISFMFIQAAALFLLYPLAKIPYSLLLKGLKSIYFFILFSSLINILFAQGNHLLFQWKFITIYQEGIILATIVTLRIILLLQLSSLLTFTTTALELTDGIEKLLHPLKKFHVPSQEIALMMSIALRFVPTMIEEADRIVKAQQSRGTDFEHGSLMKRARAFIPILIPLFLSALKRADELALAMDARCYSDNGKRTKMNQLSFSSLDFYGMMILTAYFSLLWIVQHYV